jgi:hypothetical protein
MMMVWVPIAIECSWLMILQLRFTAVGRELLEYCDSMVKGELAAVMMVVPDRGN